MSPKVLDILLLVPAFLFSLCLHEFAHGWVAERRGDPTARMAGRVSMHPLAHADFFGTFLLPVLCIYFGGPFFGWAKPVPVDPRYFKNPRRDFALVAVAGPVANILLGVLCAIFLGILVRLPIEGVWMQTLQTFTVVSIQINLMLAFFNLIPIPPLDGFNVLQGIVPLPVAQKLWKVSRVATLLLFVLLFTGAFRILSEPVYYCYHLLIAAVGIRAS